MDWKQVNLCNDDIYNCILDLSRDELRILILILIFDIDPYLWYWSLDLWSWSLDLWSWFDLIVLHITCVPYIIVPYITCIPYITSIPYITCTPYINCVPYITCAPYITCVPYNPSVPYNLCVLCRHRSHESEYLLVNN